MSKSDLENQLRFEILALYIDQPSIEYKIKGSGRNFRWDFGWEKQKLLVEVQGGTWMDKSGHNTGGGLHRDYEKNNLAVLHGYRVLYFDAEMIKSGVAIQTIKEVLE